MNLLQCTLKNRDCAGFSLLEVLVACGILVIGLASIAAVLPAAGSRLGEASAQDRAVAAAAAAFSEIQSRNMVARQLIPTGTWVSGSTTHAPSAIVFGETISLAVTSSATSSGYVIGTGSLALTATSGSVAITAGGTSLIQALLSGTVPVLSVATPSVLGSRINSDTSSTDRRGFFLEDEVQYLPSLTGNLPSNSFVNGVRQFNRGVCWGAMVTPAPAGTSWSEANAAKVSVAVFRKPGTATALSLTAAPNPASEIFVTGANTPVALQRSLLKPCSMLLVVNGTAAPQWLPIRSSWVLTGTMIGTSGTFAGVNPAATLSSVTGHTCVNFATTVPPGLGVSGTLQVIGFENLLLVSEQTLPLQ